MPNPIFGIKAQTSEAEVVNRLGPTKPAHDGGDPACLTLILHAHTALVMQLCPEDVQIIARPLARLPTTRLLASGPLANAVISGATSGHSLPATDIKSKFRLTVWEREGCCSDATWQNGEDGFLGV